MKLLDVSEDCHLSHKFYINGIQLEVRGLVYTTPGPYTGGGGKGLVTNYQGPGLHTTRVGTRTPCSADGQGARFHGGPEILCVGLHYTDAWLSFSIPAVLKLWGAPPPPRGGGGVARAL